MNESRRGFLWAMLKASIACMALPSAVTYGRLWKPVGIVRVNPAWVNATYEAAFVFNPADYQGEWTEISIVWNHPDYRGGFTIGRGLSSDRRVTH